MDVGCHLPVYGPAATRGVLVDFARRMEDLGYASLWASDHVVIPWKIASRYPYSSTGEFPLPPATPFLEPLTALALVAGVTERVRLGTTVLVLPHRHPVLAAKMLATLDHLAPGRVVLGAGVGWMREEIELLGGPYDRRGAWSDEALRVLRACWAGERVGFAGEFFRFEPVACLPRPANGTIPIWIGGHSPRALRRVVEHADGWHAAFPTPDKVEEALAALRAACGAAGRDFATLTLTARMGLPARKPAAELIAEIQALARLGITHLVLETRARDLDDMISAYTRFAREVRPQI
jgi:probable F420-dependent oxidoreductase